MIDRAYDGLRIKAFEVVKKLSESDLGKIYNGEFPDNLEEILKAAGLNPNDMIHRDALMKGVKLRLEEIFKSNSMEFNGIYFEKQAPRNNYGKKITYYHKDSIKRVNLLGARHPYPSEIFSFIIAGLEGKLTAEQRAVAGDLRKGYGEWLGAELERKGDKLILYLEDSASIEFHIPRINSQEPAILPFELFLFPKEFIRIIYTKYAWELPYEIREGAFKAQVYLPPNGRRMPLGRFDYNITCLEKDWASRGVYGDLQTISSK